MPKRGRQRLTRATLRRAPPLDGEEHIGDDQSPLVFRLRSDGRSSFIINARLHKKPIRVVCPLTARFENLAAARDWANKQMDLIRQGIDPRQVAREHKQAQAISADLTFRKSADDFIEKHAKKRFRSSAHTESVFRTLFRDRPALAKRSLGGITKADIVDALDAIEERTSLSWRNRVLTTLKLFFKWAKDGGQIEASPVAEIAMLKGENSRDRVLTLSELLAVDAAAKSMGYPFGDCVRLLLRLGLRRNEVANLKWSEVNLDQRRITLGERTKSGEKHIVPLPDESFKILSELERVPDFNDAVWCFTTTGDAPISGWSQWKTKLDAKAKVENFRLHDLRRTVATMVEQMGFPDRAVAGVLGHVKASRLGTTSVYSRSDLQPDIRAALIAVERVLLVAAGVAKRDPMRIAEVQRFLDPVEDEEHERLPEFRVAVASGAEAWQNFVFNWAATTE